MMGGGYESTASTSRERSRLSGFYAKIKEEKSAPVREILERFYEEEGYSLAKGRKEQSERVQELMTDLEIRF